MRPIRSAKRGICWKAHKIFATSQLISARKINHIHADTVTLMEKIQFLLFPLLPLAQPRALTHLSNLELTGKSKDLDILFLHAESGTIPEKHRNYYSDQCNNQRSMTFLISFLFFFPPPSFMAIVHLAIDPSSGRPMYPWRKKKSLLL